MRSTEEKKNDPIHFYVGGMDIFLWKMVEENQLKRKMITEIIIITLNYSIRANLKKNEIL